jgi:hypothetical protein
MADLVKDLGTLLARSSGDGLYATGVVKTVPMRLVAEVDTDTIERDDDGKVTYACCSFEGRFDRRHWDEDELGMPYTDKGIAASVNAHLMSLGFEGGVGWSEAGRQEDGIADFDMDYALVDQFWPELAPAASRKHGF